SLAPYPARAVTLYAMLRTLVLTAFLTIPLAACDSGPSTSKSTEAAPTPAAPAAAKPAEKPAGKPAEKPAAAPAPAAPAAAAATETAPTAPSTPADPAIAAMREFIASKKVDKQKSNWKTTLPQPPKLTFEAA